MYKYNTITELKFAWNEIVDNTEDALEWLQKNKNNQYLKDEYESLDAGLSEYREYAKRMYDNCGRVNSVGIFGESQAGKSFLVSTLISDKNGNSTIQLGNRKLDFIRDINPQGSGKESTGVVTRFSTHERCHENEKKFELVLLKELEIAKIIVNSYFNDLKDAKANLISQNDVNEIIKKVPLLKCSEREFTSYDVVSLKKYIEENYPFLDEIITERYWQIAKSTVGTLSIENRADYFSCLWNRKKLFTDLYISLTKELKKLNFAERVLVDETAVAPGLHNDDSCLSIINVDALNGLLDQSTHNQPQIDVFVDNRTVKIPLSSITALTAELVIPITNDERDFRVINKLDVLDFPGYRGRLNVRHTEIDSVPKDGMQEELGLIKELFLRGKVCYLFERYTDLFEMNCLIVCTSSQSQINSVGMPEVITSWINNTQGSDSKHRSNEKNGLFWAITQFDKKIEDFINNPKMNFGENGLLQQTILEKFGNCSWLQDWSDNQSFKNVYLVRKPRIKTSSIFVLGSDQNEIEISGKQQKLLEQMGRTFVNDSTISKYIREPQKVWDEVLKLNDGGLKNLCEEINRFPAEEKRIEFMNAKLKEVVEIIISKLYYLYTASDLSEIQNEKKKNIVALRMLCNQKSNFVKQFGYFLDFFNLATPQLVSVIDSYDANDKNVNDVENNTGNTELFSLDEENFDIANIFDDVSTESINEQHSLGKFIYRKWCEHVRGLAERIGVLQYFGMNKNHITTIVNEIIDRSKKIDPPLCKILEDGISDIEKTENRKGSMILPMSSCSSKIISEFISTFGGAISELQYKNLDENELPIIEEKAKDHRTVYLQNWLKSLATFAINNINAEAKFSIKENEKLGNILDKYKQIVA